MLFNCLEMQPIHVSLSKIPLSITASSKTSAVISGKIFYHPSRKRNGEMTMKRTALGPQGE